MKHSVILILLLIFGAALILFIATRPTLSILSPTNTLTFSSLLNLNVDWNTQSSYISEVEDLKNKIKSKDGTYAFYIKDLDTKKTYTYNADHIFYGASLYKTPIALAVLKSIQDNRLSWEQEIKIGENAHLTVRELFILLLKNSDNNAQEILTNSVPEEIFNNTFLYYLDFSGQTLYHQNQISAKGYASLLQNILNDKIYLTKDSKQIYFETLTGTAFDDRIAKSLRPELNFSHKIGNWPDTNTWHDCGIISGDANLIVCLMSENTPFEDYLEISNYLGSFL